MGTANEVETLFRSAILAQSPAKRISMACRMFATAKALVEVGILKTKCRGPGSKEFRRLIFLRLYGRDFDIKKRKKIIDYLQGSGQCKASG